MDTTGVYVWDRVVRCFHWILAALFATSYLTGEEEHWLHPYSGYGIGLLLLLRIIWGFIGSPHARFSDFVRKPGAAVAYLRELLSGGHPTRTLGHNAAGGAMVLVMLVTLTGVVLSGMQLYAVEEGKGPLAILSAPPPSAQEPDSIKEKEAATRDHDGEWDDEGEHQDGEELWEEVHEILVNFMLLLIILHIVGVLLSSRAHRESLVRSMLTGYKRPLE